MCEIVGKRFIKFWAHADFIYKWTDLYKIQQKHCDNINILTSRVNSCIFLINFFSSQTSIKYFIICSIRLATSIVACRSICRQGTTNQTSQTYRSQLICFNLCISHNFYVYDCVCVVCMHALFVRLRCIVVIFQDSYKRLYILAAKSTWRVNIFFVCEYLYVFMSALTVGYQYALYNFNVCSLFRYVVRTMLTYGTCVAAICTSKLNAQLKIYIQMHALRSLHSVCCSLCATYSDKTQYL